MYAYIITTPTHSPLSYHKYNSCKSTA